MFPLQMVHLKINTADQLHKMKIYMWDEMTHSLYSSLVHTLKDDQKEPNDGQSILKIRRKHTYMYM